MVPTVSEILVAITKLSPRERQQVLAALHLLGSSIPSNNDNRADFALSILVDFLTSSGIESTNTKVLRQSHQFKSFADKIHWIEAYFKPANRTVFGAYLQIGYKLLYENLVEMGIVISARTMMAQVHRLPGAINKGFPLYAQNEVLPFVIRHTRMKDKCTD